MNRAANNIRTKHFGTAIAPGPAMFNEEDEVEEFDQQIWIYHRRLETILQGAMLVLVAVAILILAFAPEQNAGAPVHAKAPAIRNSESHPLNFSKVPARNSN